MSTGMQAQTALTAPCLNAPCRLGLGIQEQNSPDQHELCTFTTGCINDSHSLPAPHTEEAQKGSGPSACKGSTHGRPMHIFSRNNTPGWPDSPSAFPALMHTQPLSTGPDLPCPQPRPNCQPTDQQLGALLLLPLPSSLPLPEHQPHPLMILHQSCHSFHAKSSMRSLSMELGGAEPSTSKKSRRPSVFRGRAPTDSLQGESSSQWVSRKESWGTGPQPSCANGFGALSVSHYRDAGAQAAAATATATAEEGCGSSLGAPSLTTTCRCTLSYATLSAALQPATTISTTTTRPFEPAASAATGGGTEANRLESPFQGLRLEPPFLGHASRAGCQDETMESYLVESMQVRHMLA